MPSILLFCGEVNSVSMIPHFGVIVDIGLAQFELRKPRTQVRIRSGYGQWVSNKYS
jgi:hypothetical protein